MNNLKKGKIKASSSSEHALKQKTNKIHREKRKYLVPKQKKKKRRFVPN